MADMAAVASMGGLVTTRNTARSRGLQSALYRSPSLYRSPMPNRRADLHIHYQGQCPHGPASGPSYPHDFRSSQYPVHPRYSTAACGCTQCYWREFLTDNIKQYETTYYQLRDTYLWNLRELVRRHSASPMKPCAEKDAELEKLYQYYVGRVREVYDNHSRHHWLLFHDVCLNWEVPEKVTLREEDVGPVSQATTPCSRSRAGSGSSRAPLSLSRGPTPLSRRGSNSRRDVGKDRVDKGKEKEVISSVEMGVQAPVGDGSDGKDKGKEVEASAPPNSNSIGKTQFKTKKSSPMHRFIHLLSMRPREKSVDKAEPVQADTMDENEHEADQKSMA
ncbi:hypothetical protein F5Y19DRAFT_366019 [Xylariaceae sp. FL1651]|nr:hypothetical protein F5Y19DRAFT_366019 [Xylariaceae sp. FL1651]